MVVRVNVCQRNVYDITASVLKTWSPLDHLAVNRL